MKTKEQKVIEFDSMGYDEAINDLQGFAKTLNERPYEGNDPKSLSGLKRSGIVNESFKTSCEKLGLNASQDLLKMVLNKTPQQLTGIIINELTSELNKQGLHEVVKKSIIKDQEPVMVEFINVISRLNQSYAFMRMPKPLAAAKKSIGQLENHISFVDGVALVSDETKDTIKEEVFITRIDSEARQEAFDGLKGIADAINQFNANITKRGTNLKLMSPDLYYYNLEGDFVTPDNSNIKYF